MTREEVGPPRSGGGNEWALGLCLGAVVLSIGAADLAGALANAISGGPFDPVSFSTAGTFVGHLLAHPKDPAALWSGVGHAAFGPAVFFVAFGVIVLTVIGASVGLCRLGRRAFAPGAHDGFATPAALWRTASLFAARRRAAQTRPSLALSGRRPWQRAPKPPGREVGYPLGVTRRPKGVALWASWEVSMQLVAPMGSGKTMRVLAHALRQHPGPVLATSTKPDLYEVSVGARVRARLRARPRGPRARGGQSPLVAGRGLRGHSCRRAAGVCARSRRTVRRAMRAPGSSSASRPSPCSAPISMPRRSRARRWPTSSAGRRDRPTATARRILTRAGDQSIDWAARLHEHTSGAPETTSGVTRTVDLALACFRHREVLALSAIDPDEAFNIEQALVDNATIYVLGKDRPGVSAGVGPLITAFCDELLLGAEQLAARQRGRRLDPPLLALLDEAPNIVPLPSLPALVADGRGRGIVVVYAMQSFSQAIERWGAPGATTLRNATTITAVFGGLSVAQDLRELSDLCGTRRVARHSVTSDPRRAHDSYGASWVDEPVLTPAEIHGLPDGELLLLWGSLPPILAYQPGVWEGREARRIAEQERSARDANDAARGMAKRRAMTVDELAPGISDGELTTPWSGAARTGVAPFSFPDNTRPWNWLELDRGAAEQLWRILSEFVAFFNARYGERADLRIPPCWADHGPLIEELTTLWWARWQAFESAHASIGGAQYWHTYTVQGFFERISRWLGPDRLERCRQGLHEDREEPASSESDEVRPWTAVAALDLAQRDERPTAAGSKVDPNAQRLPIPFLERD